MVIGWNNLKYETTDMKIDSHLLKLSASPIYIESPLELGSEVTGFFKGEVVKVEDKDNQDNSFNRTYTVKGVIAERLEDL